MNNKNLKLKNQSNNQSNNLKDVPLIIKLDNKKIQNLIENKNLFDKINKIEGINNYNYTYLIYKYNNFIFKFPVYFRITLSNNINIKYFIINKENIYNSLKKKYIYLNDKKKEIPNYILLLLLHIKYLSIIKEIKENYDYEKISNSIQIYCENDKYSYSYIDILSHVNVFKNLNINADNIDFDKVIDKFNVDLSVYNVNPSYNMEDKKNSMLYLDDENDGEYYFYCCNNVDNNIFLKNIQTYVTNGYIRNFNISDLKISATQNYNYYDNNNEYDNNYVIEYKNKEINKQSEEIKNYSLPFKSLINFNNVYLIIKR